MSEDKIQTKKKEKSVWNSIGKAALAIGSIVVVAANARNKNQKQ